MLGIVWYELQYVITEDTESIYVKIGGYELSSLNLWIRSSGFLCLLNL